MKDLPHPSLKDIAHLVDRFNYHKAKINLKDLFLATSYCRLDGRIAEVLTEYLCEHWFELNPVEINSLIINHPFSSTWGVILDQIADLAEETNELFEIWRKKVLAQIKPSPQQLFFIGTLKPGGRGMQAEIRQSRPEFIKWGYWGKDIFFNKQIPKKMTSPSKDKIKYDLCEKIISIKTRQNLSGVELAKILQINPSAVSRICNHDTQLITIDFLVDKLDKLKAPVNSLF